MAIWSILQPFGIFYGNLAFLSRFVTLYQGKSGKRAWANETKNLTKAATSKNVTIVGQQN
jgi:hypothetical protein